jgi:hypothetical protein
MKDFKVSVFVISFLICLVTKAQIKYAGKVEAGYSVFLIRTLIVKAGPNWKGYNLDKCQNGKGFSVINGLSFFKNKIGIGMGVSYLNFEGISGVATFGEIEYLPSKSPLSPIINARLGLSRIWNQYQNGTETTFFGINAGLNYKIKNKVGIYLSTGIDITQQSFLLPIKSGIRF